MKFHFTIALQCKFNLSETAQEGEVNLLYNLIYNIKQTFSLLQSFIMHRH